MMQRIKIWAKMSIKAHTLALHYVKMAIDFKNRFSSLDAFRSKEDVEACLGANGFFLTTLERRTIEQRYFFVCIVFLQQIFFCQKAFRQAMPVFMKKHFAKGITIIFIRYRVRAPPPCYALVQFTAK